MHNLCQVYIFMSFVWCDLDTERTTKILIVFISSQMSCSHIGTEYFRYWYLIIITCIIICIDLLPIYSV